MASTAFDWSALPAGLLRQLKDDLGLGASPAAALARKFGSRPDEEFIRLTWPALRERWIARDPVVRHSLAAELRAKGLGDATPKLSSAKAEVKYLRSCRNSAGLRATVLSYLVAIGAHGATPKAAVKGGNTQATSPVGLSTAWPGFARELARTLAQLEVDQYLILSARQKPDHYVQFAQQGPSGLRAETVSNAFLEEWEQLDEQAQSKLLELGWHAPTTAPPQPLDPDGSPNYFRDWPLPVPYEAVAALAVQTLQQVVDVRHPGLLSYKAFAKGGSPLVLPNLGLVRVPLPAPKTTEQTPVDRAPVAPSVPNNPAELMDQVKAVFKVLLNLNEVQLDPDGDIPLHSDSAFVYIRVQKQAPIVSVFAPLVWNIGEPDDIETTVNQLNLGNFWLRVYWNGTGVVAQSDVVGNPLSADQLRMAFVAVADLVEQQAKQLQQRYGGSISTGPPLPVKQSHPIGFQPAKAH